MTAKILSGKAVSDAIKAEVEYEVANLFKLHGFSPCLVVVRVGDDPASSVYVNNKVRTANEIGVISEHLHFPSDAKQEVIAAVVGELNECGDVDGILVQLPLPEHIDEREILERIDPEKDVDGFHPVNTGRLTQGYPALSPCTPAGVIEMLRRSEIEMAGKHAVIVGRSNIVGKPMALLLLKENATVTLCHSRTTNLAEITKQANILVAAVGRAAFIHGDHIGKGATVIDVGINNISDRSFITGLFDGDELEKRLSAIEKRGFTLVGDVNPKAAMAKAANFTPVPGGVGLLTVAMLMKNTLTAAKNRRLK